MKTSVEFIRSKCPLTSLMVSTIREHQSLGWAKTAARLHNETNLLTKTSLNEPERLSIGE